MTSVNVPPTRRPHLSSNKEINTSTGTASTAHISKAATTSFQRQTRALLSPTFQEYERCILTPTLYAITLLSVCPALSVTLVFCGQTVGRIKVKLGMQVGLGTGHIVLDGDPAPLPQKVAEPPIFGPYLL